MSPSAPPPDPLIFRKCAFKPDIAMDANIRLSSAGLACTISYIHHAKPHNINNICRLKRHNGFTNILLGTCMFSSHILWHATGIHVATATKEPDTSNLDISNHNDSQHSSSLRFPPRLTSLLVCELLIEVHLNFYKARIEGSTKACN